tara:strand:+ start:569 stop:1957 length:1389 start_codon:yes stop_codon:yes gene_type:complete
VREVENSGPFGDSIIPHRTLDFSVCGLGPWSLVVPATVYPPREDTRILADAIMALDLEPSTAVEVGCGSGALSILLAENGWDVFAFDVNPYAVAASRSNVDESGHSNRVTVNEGGVGEPGWKIPKRTGLIVWNLPYLNPLDDEALQLEPIEEASMTDIPNGGWSAELMSHVCDCNEDGLIVLLLMRSDPKSPSNKEDWMREGWSSRVIKSLRMGDEKIEAVAFWRPGLGLSPVIVDECNSTMTESQSLPEDGWQRIRSRRQHSGRGRGESKWESREGDITATWRVVVEDEGGVFPGLIQTSVGAAVANIIGCRTKWPNDLIDKQGMKLGGIMVESSSNELGIRVGVGINSSPRMISEDRVSGWSETLGPVSADIVFGSVDSSISGILEVVPGLPSVSSEALLDLSWRGISSSLSEGAFPSFSGNEARVVGLDIGGGLILEREGDVSIVTDLDTVEWFFPTGS